MSIGKMAAAMVGSKFHLFFMFATAHLSHSFLVALTIKSQFHCWKASDISEIQKCHEAFVHVQQMKLMTVLEKSCHNNFQAFQLFILLQQLTWSVFWKWLHIDSLWYAQPSRFTVEWWIRLNLCSILILLWGADQL